MMVHIEFFRETKYFCCSISLSETKCFCSLALQSTKHLQPFDNNCAALGPKLVSATVAVFNGIALSPQFAPTAIKFHYQFNMRDVAKIVQNIMLSQPSSYKGNPTGLVRLWAHECHRVWLDRLLFDEDVNMYMNYNVFL